MPQPLVRSRKATGLLALGALLMLQLAACGGSAPPRAANPMVGRVTAQTHAHAVTAATPAPAGALVSVAQAAGLTSASGPLTFNSDYVNAVIAITNQERAANGCGPLTPNPLLMGTAQAHSNDMALNHYFAHDSPSGLTPGQRILAAGYSYAIEAENIAAGYDTPQAVMSAWFNETPPNDPHRRNILDCRLHDIGVGYCYLANDPNQIAYHSYWTEDFGTLA